MRRFACVIALLCLATACGTVNYPALKPGAFSGALLVMWVGEGDPAQGAGKFVYVPSPGDPLTFTRANGQVITPEVMYTDGGSIPRGAQVFNGFSPWGYAPAYMIHDWVFVAKRCREDGWATVAEAELSGMTFQDSAEILGEAIKTLVDTGRVAANDVAPRVISGAVSGPASLARWTARDECRPKDRLTEAHDAQVKAALAPQPALARRGAGRDQAVIVAPPQAQLVTTITFP